MAHLFLKLESPLRADELSLYTPKAEIVGTFRVYDIIAVFGIWDLNVVITEAPTVPSFHLKMNSGSESLLRCHTYRGPKDHISIRILHTVASVIPIVLGLGTRK